MTPALLTPTFVLYVCAWATLALIGALYACDVHSWWDGSPFAWLGCNPIVVYTSHMLLRGYFPFALHSDGLHDGLTASAALGVAAWFAVALWLRWMDWRIRL